MWLIGADMELSFCDLRAKEVVNICDGRNLGNIVDMIIDCRYAQVLGIVVPYERSFWSFFKPNKDIFIPWHRICKIGKDVILVDIIPSHLPQNCSTNSGRRQNMLLGDAEQGMASTQNQNKDHQQQKTNQNSFASTAMPKNNFGNVSAQQSSFNNSTSAQHNLNNGNINAQQNSFLNYEFTNPAYQPSSPENMYFFNNISSQQNSSLVGNPKNFQQPTTNANFANNQVYSQTQNDNNIHISPPPHLNQNNNWQNNNNSN